VAITALPAEREDVADTRRAIETEGRRCIVIEGDLTDPDVCIDAVERTVAELGQLDILVSNAADQNHKPSIEDVDDEEWDRTFKTNVYAYYRLVKAALPHLGPGASIIATGSITGIQGSGELPDYSATKGAIHTLTKSLAQSLVKRGIRVNCVAPGPVWTPLNVADEGTSSTDVAEFGSEHASGAAGAAGRDRAGVRVSGVGCRFQFHHRRRAAGARRRDGRRVIRRCRADSRRRTRS